MKKKNVIYLLERNKCVVNSYKFNMQIYYKLILDDLEINTYEELINNLKTNKNFRKELQEATKNYFQNDNIRIISNKDYSRWYFLELKNISTLKYNLKKIIYNIKHNINNAYSLRKAVN